MLSPQVILKSLALMLALFAVPLSLFGLCCVITWQGTLLSSAAGLLGLGPLLYWIGDKRGSTQQMRLGKIFVVTACIAAAVVLWQTPDARTSEASRIHSRYSDGGWHYDRFSIGSVLPEIDQIHLGYAVASALDPLFTQKQRRELSAMTDAIYAQAGADPDFTAAGSALPSIYSEMTLGQFRDGHYYHYIPAKVDRTRPTPALVFLHGSGGNFKAYIWLLSQLADELGITAIDPAQIHLMGLSNGGKGLCLAESAAGPKFRSLIFLSAVLHSRIRPAQLAARLHPRPVLILSGDSDDRVPWEYVSDYADTLKAGGLDVTTHRFAGEDHFVFFRKSAEVQKLVSAWVRR
ncbi:alpha/beta hydrolase [Prosthecobacter fluviatilis]|uniref:Alpha/beta hydrolase n=1 Tax=Prosthecobacter fluviatilis TaxID=445931 RepID=A0ABW0KLH9_9BACT